MRVCREAERVCEGVSWCVLRPNQEATEYRMLFFPIALN